MIPDLEIKGAQVGQALSQKSTLQHLFAPGSFQLFDLIYREETLFNVIKSVTRNGRSILLTALLALILVYLFSIVGFLFLKDDFILEVDRLPDSKAQGEPSHGLLWQSTGPSLRLHHCVQSLMCGPTLFGKLVLGLAEKNLPALI